MLEYLHKHQNDFFRVCCLSILDRKYCGYRKIIIRDVIKIAYRSAPGMCPVNFESDRSQSYSEKCSFVLINNNQRNPQHVLLYKLLRLNILFKESQTTKPVAKNVTE